MIVVVDGESLRDALISLDDCSEITLLALNKLSRAINYLFGPVSEQQKVHLLGEDDRLLEIVENVLSSLLATVLQPTTLIRALAYQADQFNIDIYLEVIDGDF